MKTRRKKKLTAADLRAAGVSEKTVVRRVRRPGEATKGEEADGRSGARAGADGGAPGRER